MGTRTLLTAVLSAAVLGVAVTGCGSPDPTAATAAPIDPTSAAVNAPGIPLGSEVTVAGIPGAIGSIRVSGSRSWARSSRPLSDPPREGAFVEVKVDARSIGTELFDLYPYDFYVADAAGHRFEYGVGMSFAEYGPDQIEGDRLAPGERLSGALLFDASPRADRLVYAPYGLPLQTWRLQG